MGAIRLKQIKDAKQLIEKVNKIENTVKNIANPSLDGYEKPSETSAVTENDSLQAAIGKVEAGIDTKLGKTEAAVNALKVNNHTVESDVPANAVFTDTVYSEATAHDAGLLSASDKSKLDGIASGAQKNTVTGVKGESETTYRTGNINITKENIGLGNVDNTADAVKSVSYAENAGAVNGHAVDIDVPANAKFTDTTYSTMSSNEAATGTATTARTITAKVLADYVAACIANLVNSAPNTLDTLKELADALGNDPNFAATMATALGNKLGKTETAANAAKVNNLTVQTAVPANAKFTDTTYSNFVKSGSGAKAGLVPAPSTTAGTTKYLREDGTWQVPPDNNTVYTHPTTSGNKHIPSGGSSGQILRWSADGTAVWGNDNNTTYSEFVKSGSGAKAGLVPSPGTTAGTAKYLREDGTWQVPPDNNTTYTAASAAPKAAGTAAVGTSAKYAREDHVHPLQTSVSGSSGSCTGNAATATSSTTQANRDNSTKIATTAFVYNNANKMITANTTIYVSKTGTGDGTTAAKAMSIDNLALYLATAKMQASSGGLNDSYTLTVAFVPAGSTYGTVSFDGNKMPGIKNIVITTSTGTNTTTSNYTTNAPLFDNLYFRGAPVQATVRNVEVAGTINAALGARVVLDTYVGFARITTDNYGRIDLGNGTYNIHNANTSNLAQAGEGGSVYINTATAIFNFRELCYYTDCIFRAYEYGRIYLNYGRMKYTGTQPVVVLPASGTQTGTSNTAAGTAAKAVTLASGQSFTLANNAVAYVKFDNTNTAANPTLNINNTGAKPIYFGSAAIPANYLMKGVLYKFTYNGTNYVCNNAFNRVENVFNLGWEWCSSNYNTTYNSGSWNWNGFSRNWSGSAYVNGTIYGYSTGLATARAIDGVNFNGTGAITHYGSCSTAAATAAKTVACAGFTLVTGAKIAVKFTVTNTAANPTLNVQSTGAKAIYYRGAAISAGYLAANRTYEFIYNGTQYELVGDLDTNSTYTAASAAPKAAGTAAAGTSTKYAREDHVHPLQTSVSGSSGSCTGNAATATTINRAPTGTSWVAGATAGQALISSTTTSFGAIWNAPAKNYRVACSTHPGGSEDLIRWYSVTNANVSAGTNTVTKQMTWNASNGYLTTDRFVGYLQGNCSGSSTSCTGNAATAAKINGKTIAYVESFNASTGELKLKSLS